MDIGDSFQRATDGLFGFLPNLLGFLVILVIGFIVAKIVASLVSKVLEKVGVDRKLHESEAHNYVEKIMPGASPSKGIARVVFWLIFVFFLVSAIGALKISAVTTFMNQVLAYLPNVIVAILIIVLAALIAGAVAGAVAKTMGDTPTGKIVATVVPAIVMVIAMFMILNQLKIAEEIVTIAFAATMGALALGLALAFGLGGRPVAERLLEDAYRKGQDQREQVRSDMATGRDRARAHAQDAQSRLQSDPGYSNGVAHDAGYGATEAGYSSTTGYTNDTGYTDSQATQQWEPRPGDGR